MIIENNVVFLNVRYIPSKNKNPSYYKAVCAVTGKSKKYPGHFSEQMIAKDFAKILNENADISTALYGKVKGKQGTYFEFNIK